MTKIKICGIYREEDASFINEAGPDYFGMIINFPKSHRNVSIDRARQLRMLIDRNIPAVGVFVNEAFEVIEGLLKEGIIDIPQLHGSETQEEIAALKKKTGKPVWKAFKIRSREDMEKAVKSPADMIILDNGYGTGKTFDWSVIGSPARPFALAGGITCENMEAAIKTVSPALIDISSGVETDRKKDREKIICAVNMAHKGQ